MPKSEIRINVPIDKKQLFKDLRHALVEDDLTLSEWFWEQAQRQVVPRQHTPNRVEPRCPHGMRFDENCLPCSRGSGVRTEMRSATPTHDDLVANTPPGRQAPERHNDESAETEEPETAYDPIIIKVAVQTSYLLGRAEADDATITEDLLGNTILSAGLLTKTKLTPAMQREVCAWLKENHEGELP